LESIYHLAVWQEDSLESARGQAKYMYRTFLGSAKAMKAELWEEFYHAGNPSCGIDADSFAEAAAESLPDAEALLQLSHDVGVVLSFDLMTFLLPTFMGVTY
jgi:hypothetical protein